MEGWCTVPVPLKQGSRCTAEHQGGQTWPAVPLRWLHDQPQHFRGTNKNCLGLARDEQPGVEELVASPPFLWGYGQGMVPWLCC